MKITDKCLGILFVISILTFPSEAQICNFKSIKWEKQKIAPGLVWRSSHTSLSDSSRQNINMLIISTAKREISLVYDPLKNSLTSLQASQAGALAAVNAGFFDMKNGGSATYIKVNGNVTDSDTARKWKRVTNMNGSVIISYSGRLTITGAMQNSWYDNNKESRDALITGPLLIKDGEKAILPETSLVTSRHPRTCIGLKGRNRVILLTVDGRSKESEGMTLPAMADILLSLRCRNAVNLDGGGSSTMWINGKPFNGIVNMPCDNRKFDHYGERAVSDILVIR